MVSPLLVPLGLDPDAVALPRVGGVRVLFVVRVLLDGEDHAEDLGDHEAGAADDVKRRARIRRGPHGAGAVDGALAARRRVEGHRALPRRLLDAHVREVEGRPRQVQRRAEDVEADGRHAEDDAPVLLLNGAGDRHAHGVGVRAEQEEEGAECEEQPAPEET